MWFENRDYYFINVITGLTGARVLPVSTDLAVYDSISFPFPFCFCFRWNDDVIGVTMRCRFVMNRFHNRFPIRQTQQIEVWSRDEKCTKRQQEREWKQKKKRKFTYRGRWPFAGRKAIFHSIVIRSSDERQAVYARARARAFLFLVFISVLCCESTEWVCGASNGFMSY